MSRARGSHGIDLDGRDAMRQTDVAQFPNASTSVTWNGHRRDATHGTAMLGLALVILLTGPAHATSPPSRFGSLVHPVSPACVSSPFGPRVLAGRPKAGTFHPGIDLPAPEGAPVRAVAHGHVIRAQRKGPGGFEMLIQHDGFIGVYSHLGRLTPAIAEGKRSVRAGDMVATIGRSGVTYGTHLYFGILVDRQPIDPAPWLGIAPCPRTGGATSAQKE